jgi:ActR/RegA family two-component response regulator
MTSREEWAAVGIVLLLLTGLFALVYARDAFKAEAVKRGAAEWLVNPDNGETTFQWKDIKP